MTYNTKNTTIVFAFAALLLVMPLAGSNAFAAELMDADLVASCGFTITSAGSINFGSFNRANDAATVGEEDAVFPALGTATASTRVEVQMDDWVGAGTRSVGTVTLVSLADTENVVVGAKTYVGVDAASSALNFDRRGGDIAAAASLATQIRDQDPLFLASTGGTNVVTLEVKLRGTGGDGTTLSTSSASSSVSAFAGASDTNQIIMNFDTTKVTFHKDAAQSNSYASKTAITAKNTNQEVLGSTDPTDAVYLAIMIDPASATFTNLPYDGPLTQSITISVDTGCDAPA